MNKLKELRKKQGLRQIDLARESNVSLTWIWVLENDFHHRVSREIKERVARVLSCKYEELFHTK